MAASAEPKELALLSKAARALSQAKSLDEVVAIRDKAVAAQVFVRAAKLGTELYNDAAELKLRAERQAGEMLTANGFGKQGGDRKSKDIVSLDSIGVESHQSKRWQRIASIPEDDFEEHISLAKGFGRELTTASVLRLAKELKQEAEIEIRSDAAKSFGIVSDLRELVNAGAKFGAIYADPPWAYSNKATRSNVDSLYKATMSVEEICAEPVAAIAAEKSHLHLWTTNGFLFDAKRVMEAWGFEYKSCFIWVKPQMGIGNYWRVSHEFMLLGVRGGLTFLDHAQKSWMELDRTKHSRKPNEVRRTIEKVSPGPWLEMYGRQVLGEGWTVYGNEVEDAGLF